MLVGQHAELQLEGGILEDARARGDTRGKQLEEVAPLQPVYSARHAAIEVVASALV